MYTNRAFLLESCISKSFHTAAIQKDIFKVVSCFLCKRWVGCLVVSFKADCLTRDLSLLGLGLCEVFLRDPSPYLREFRRKPPKTSNGQVDIHDRGLYMALPVYQFLAQNPSDKGGAQDGQFDIHTLARIRNRELRYISRFP